MNECMLYFQFAHDFSITKACLPLFASIVHGSFTYLLQASRKQMTTSNES